MSNNHSELKEPSPRAYKLGVIAFLGVMLIFAAVVWVPYFGNRPAPVNEDIVAERKATLADVQAKQQELINSYAWADKEAKKVQMPVTRAMQLTVNDLKRKAATESVLAPEPSAAKVE